MAATVRIVPEGRGAVLLSVASPNWSGDLVYDVYGNLFLPPELVVSIIDSGCGLKRLGADAVLAVAARAGEPAVEANGRRLVTARVAKSCLRAAGCKHARKELRLLLSHCKGAVQRLARTN